MISELFCMVLKFLDDELMSCIDFTESYIEKYRFIRDYKKIIYKYPLLDTSLSSIFVMADAYNPDDDRADYDLDESGLREGIKVLLITNGILDGEYNFNDLSKDSKFIVSNYTQRIKNDPSYSRKQLDIFGIFPISLNSDYCSILKKLNM